MRVTVCSVCFSSVIFRLYIMQCGEWRGSSVELICTRNERRYISHALMRVAVPRVWYIYTYYIYIIDTSTRHGRCQSSTALMLWILNAVLYDARCDGDGIRANEKGLLPTALRLLAENYFWLAKRPLGWVLFRVCISMYVSVRVPINYLLPLFWCVCVYYTVANLHDTAAYIHI